MILLSTKNSSFYEFLLKKNKTLLLIFVFIVIGFNVFAQTSSLITDCDDFVAGPNSTWTHVLVATTIADGSVSQGSQTFTMNITDTANGGSVRVYKTTANGSSFFGNPVALTLGLNTITVAAVTFDRAVKFQFSNGDVEFDALSLNGVASTCIGTLPPPPSSLISDCDDFVAGPNSTWTHVLVATTIADGSVSQGSQTFTMNITDTANGGSVRVYKTTANGSSFFGNPVALTLGLNTITVAAVTFDRAVKFQFSNGDVEFDALSLNGVASTCIGTLPPPPSSLISDCDDFVAGPNSTWTHVLVATTIADGSVSQGSQTFTMNITDTANGGSVRVYKTTANGSSFFGNPVALTLGLNTITVAAVTFDRAVKFQFSNGDVEFDALSLNGVASTCIGTTLVVSGCTDPTANNYDATATVDDGSCIATVYGCTDASQSNYDPLANVDDGSCIPVVLGCTDPLAVNYNATVNTDDGSCLYSGCTDPLASNYDANATIDDGSCSYGPSLCAGSAITGLSVSDIIHDRATFNFDNMNTYDATGAQVCRVDQIRIKYRPVGTSSWSQKNMAQPTGYDAVTGICNSTQNTAKITRNLMSSTTYEWEVKVWYCDGQNSGFVAGPNFTTADDCPNVGNLTAYGANPTMATFTWDNSNGAYSFVRLKARVDSISNPTGSDFFQIGGAGVSYGIYTKNKQNMVPGETYRGQARTYCDPNGGPYRSPSWSPLVFWTQPTVRIEGGISIANLDVYPNPSRDVFNVAFTSEDVQDLEVRVINVVGEVVYTESLQQFVGEYTKLIDLAENTKGVYFLEITTNTGVVNKKLMLQ